MRLKPIPAGAAEARSSGRNCPPAKDWERLRALAWITPLAINWPGGRMAF